MLADLCLHFPEARAVFDRADRLSASTPRGYTPSDYIFARPTFSEDERAWSDERLTHMDEAVESVLTANQAVYAVLTGLGLRPDVIVGHSTGDYSALAAAGVLDLDREEDQAMFGRALGGDAATAATPETAVLLAVGADRQVAEAIAREAGGDLYVAMDNCPHQSVLVGGPDAAARAVGLLQRDGLIYEALAFDRPYHTPGFAAHAERLASVYAGMTVQAARLPVYSCTTGALLPSDPAEIRRIMVDHWVRPVQFRGTIEALYADGVRLFVEAGARGNLSAFVEDILRGQAFCAVPADVQRRTGITQLNHLVGLLAVHGVDLDVDYLYRRRSPRLVDWRSASDAAHVTRRSTRIPLATGWPMLQLTPAAADRVRPPTGSTPATQSPTAADTVGLPPAHATAEAQPPTYAANVGPPTPRADGEPPRSATETLGLPPTYAAPDGRPPAYAATDAGWPAPAPVSAPRPAAAAAAPQTSAPTADAARHATDQLAAWTAVDPRATLPEPVEPPAPTAWPGAGQPMAVPPPVGSPSHAAVPGEAGAAGWMAVPAGGAQAAVQDYLQAMDTFLAVQERVMQAYLTPAPTVTAYPLLGTLTSHTPDQELVAVREVSLAEDLYLRDHTLGRDVALYPRAEDDLHGLAVMPLAMSLEILAEAAAYLVPGLTVTGLRGVRANRWLSWEDDERHTLQITARRLASPNPHEAWVAVQLRDLTADQRSDSPPHSPVVEATLVLAAEYPLRPAPRPLGLANGVASGWQPHQLYTDGMFHGPAWQGLTGVDQTSPTGIAGRIRVLPETGLFASHPSPHFELDPVVLDSAGQAIGLWTLEHLASGQVIFPFQLDALDIFGPRRPVGEEVGCVAEIRVDRRQTGALRYRRDRRRRPAVDAPERLARQTVRRAAPLLPADSLARASRAECAVARGKSWRRRVPPRRPAV